jgi:glycosyltransferase involved in cell wall biosynthesis
MNLILDTLEKVDDMNVILVGPCSVEIPEHPRLHLFGTVERRYIFELMRVTKALIMPFMVNKLIESVNPVKLYEYIYCNKPVIASYYEETSFFEDYVYLYKSPEQFVSLCKDIVNNRISAKSSAESNVAYVTRNQWSDRYEIVKNTLMALSR